MAIRNHVNHYGDVVIYTVSNLRSYKNNKGNIVAVTITKDNIHIVDSYKISKRVYMKDYLNDIRKCGKYDYCEVFNRSNFDMINEWVTHNNLYKLGICKDRTIDVDLDYPQKWYYSVLWFLGGLIAL